MLERIAAFYAALAHPESLLIITKGQDQRQTTRQQWLLWIGCVAKGFVVRQSKLTKTHTRVISLVLSLVTRLSK